MNSAVLKGILLAAGVYAVPVFAQDMPLNLTKGVTDISQQVYHLHMTIFYICVVIGIVVFGIMFYAMLRHRKSRGVTPANFHESTKVEILWTLIPFVILIGMAIPAAKTLLAMEDTHQSELTVLVTGSQWKWHYRYMDTDVAYYSSLATQQEQIHNKFKKDPHYLREVDRPLIIPTHQKVRFLLTSDDVIHSWWVPDFAIKKDANPGFINEAWTRVNKPGVYRGQCAELCGQGHGFMPIVVIAKPPQEFNQWLDTQKQLVRQAKAEEQKLLAMNMSKQELMATGQKVYQSVCAACHQPNGEGLPGMFPSLKGSAVATGDINKHINTVVNGVSGTAMQAFGKQLSLKQLAGVITYERNAWGNDTGDVIQAKDVNAIIKGK